MAAAFISAQTGDEPSSDAYQALAMLHEGRLVAAAMYSGYYPKRDISVHFAADRKSLPLIGRAVARALFSYPFGTLQLPRLSASTSEHNHDCLRLAMGLGFHLEGRKPRAGTNGEDLILLGCFPENIKGRCHGFQP
jgi:hypothetical protein